MRHSSDGDKTTAVVKGLAVEESIQLFTMCCIPVPYRMFGVSDLAEREPDVYGSSEGRINVMYVDECA